MVLSEQESKQLLEVMIKQMVETTRFAETRNYMQHGTVSVYDHCIQVARKSCEIASRHRMDVDYFKLIRGALLHDYFLYDWHDKDSTHRLHGFFHPGKACHNAKMSVDLSQLEEDIIKHHMFPLTVIPPKSREAWVVCLADKLCATSETIHRYRAS